MIIIDTFFLLFFGRQLINRIFQGNIHLSDIRKICPNMHNCPGGARFYGDLDDPSSDASQAVAAADPAAVHRLTDVGNAPATCYILSDHYAEWQESSTLQGSGRYLQKEGE